MTKNKLIGILVSVVAATGLIVGVAVHEYTINETPVQAQGIIIQQTEQSNRPTTVNTAPTLTAYQTKYPGVYNSKATKTIITNLTTQLCSEGKNISAPFGVNIADLDDLSQYSGSAATTKIKEFNTQANAYLNKVIAAVRPYLSIEGNKKLNKDINLFNTKWKNQYVNGDLYNTVGTDKESLRPSTVTVEQWDNFKAEAEAEAIVQFANAIINPCFSLAINPSDAQYAMFPNEISQPQSSI